MHIKAKISLLISLSLFLATPAVRAATPADRAQIVKVFVEQIPFLKKRFDGSADSRTEHPVVLIVTSESEFLKDLSPGDASYIIMPQAEVIATQLASFASLSRLTINGDHAVLSYDIPAGDRAGDMRFKKTDGQWKKTSRNETRSMAGARVFYGRFYEGAVCRDGTEMAYRWNYLASRRAATYGGTCPGREFPDVKVYRRQQAAPGR